MKTPRIEEKREIIRQQVFIKPASLDDAKNIWSIAEEAFEQALAEAHQAGKIQALHLLEDLYAKAKDKAELIEMFNEALQDNK